MNSPINIGLVNTQLFILYSRKSSANNIKTIETSETNRLFFLPYNLFKYRQLLLHWHIPINFFT